MQYDMIFKVIILLGFFYNILLIFDKSYNFYDNKKESKSEKTKLKEGYGTGTGANYIPYIQTREFNSKGTTCNARDWITGRTVELLSQTEMRVWYLLRWDERVVDIREQFPLDLEITKKIADDSGITERYVKWFGYEGFL